MMNGETNCKAENTDPEECSMNMERRYLLKSFYSCDVSYFILGVPSVPSTSGAQYGSIKEHV